jgi:hypothetical protein
LIFPHDAFMTVGLALHTVLKNACVLGQQANHFELATGRAELVPVGREADGLPNGKLRRCHHRLSYRMFLPSQKAFVLASLPGG